MDTTRVEDQWQMLMEMASALKKEGIDTGDLVLKLREAKVLLNHVVYDEHAHGDELLEAELAVDEVQQLIVSILKRSGREDDFPFKEARSQKKDRTSISVPPPRGLKRGERWIRLRLSGTIEESVLLGIEGTRVLEKDEGHITIAGTPDTLNAAVKEIARAFKR